MKGSLTASLLLQLLQLSRPLKYFLVSEEKSNLHKVIIWHDNVIIFFFSAEDWSNQPATEDWSTAPTAQASDWGGATSDWA